MYGEIRAALPHVPFKLAVEAVGADANMADYLRGQRDLRLALDDEDERRFWLWRHIDALLEPEADDFDREPLDAWVAGGERTGWLVVDQAFRGGVQTMLLDNLCWLTRDDPRDGEASTPEEWLAYWHEKATGRALAPVALTPLDYAIYRASVLQEPSS